jgi:metal-dependent hydrolase (beta-lactamase superfamily II)
MEAEAQELPGAVISHRHDDHSSSLLENDHRRPRDPTNKRARELVQLTVASSNATGPGIR